MPDMCLAQDPDADALLTRSPLALLIGMVLDQQIPLEKAFRGPLVLAERIGDLDAARIADYDEDALVAAFATPPALHRFPKAMAARVQELCRQLVASYDGDASHVWTTARDGDELLRRVRGLPGFGEQKARIFVALLGKQLGVRPRRWREAAGAFGKAGSHLSVADIVDAESLGRVRAYKQQLKSAAKASA